MPLRIVAIAILLSAVARAEEPRRLMQPWLGVTWSLGGEVASVGDDGHDLLSPEAHTMRESGGGVTAHLGGMAGWRGTGTWQPVFSLVYGIDVESIAVRLHERDLTPNTSSMTCAAPDCPRINTNDTIDAVVRWGFSAGVLFGALFPPAPTGARDGVLLSLHYEPKWILSWAMDQVFPLGVAVHLTWARLEPDSWGLSPSLIAGFAETRSERFDSQNNERWQTDSWVWTVGFALQWLPPAR